MRHDTAVRRLRTIAEGCDKLGSLLDSEDGLVAVYAFGPVLDHPGEDLNAVSVALVMGLPAAELPRGVETTGCTSLAHLLRLLDRRPRSTLWPARTPRRYDSRALMTTSWPSRSRASSSRRARTFARSGMAAGTTSTGDGQHRHDGSATARTISGRPSTAISTCSMRPHRFTLRCDCSDRRGAVASAVWGC